MSGKQQSTGAAKPLRDGEESVVLTFRVPKSDADLIRAEVKKRRTTIGDLLREALGVKTG
jgi:hypothetical protein